MHPSPIAETVIDAMFLCGISIILRFQDTGVISLIVSEQSVWAELDLTGIIYLPGPAVDATEIDFLPGKLRNICPSALPQL